MCSILGYVNTKNSLDTICELNNKLSHRGPDNSTVKEYWINSNKTILAHNRLAIQDLDQHANQPMENDKFIIVFNGEIYNHLEIRDKLSSFNFRTHSDTETLLCAFTQFGIDQTLSMLIGMFSIGLLNKENGKFYLIRDRLGIKPLYWSYQDGELAFASELKGFTDSLKKLNSDKSLVQFMCLGYIPNDKSYYENISKLQPGHYLEFNGKDIDIQKYWNFSKEKKLTTFENAVTNTRNLLESSVNYRLLSDLEVGCFLSGGIDSSLIAAIMQQQSQKQIKTFSIGFENKRYDESPYAKEIANYINSDHYEYIFKAQDVLELIEDFDYYYDEPFGDASALPMMLLSKVTKQHVTVALSGDGGDELFLGYDRYFLTQKYYNLFKKFPQLLRSPLSIAFKYSSIDKLEKLSHPLKNLSKEGIYSLLYSSIKPWELHNCFSNDFIYEAFGKNSLNILDILDYTLSGESLYDQFSDLDINRYLPDDILTKVDRATMAYSLEARVPLLDHRVVEYAYSVPSNVKLSFGAKSILKDILFQYIPKELLDRPKRGFSVPLQEWFRNELKDLVYDKINSLDERFNKQYLNKVADQHIYKNKNFEYVLWNILRIK